MRAPAIKVEGLGKEYVIGAREKVYGTLRELVASNLVTPLRRFRKLSGRVGAEERFWALKDVNFEIGEGEVVGIIGRNGAGKSTLLKILARITEPTEGSVEVRGRVASLLEVGTGFHPELTGRENIYLNGAILGMSRAEIKRKFDEIVAFAEVENFINTPVKRYSSGMYVRLAFAVAAHLEQEILIVDEVLAVGDASFQKKCLGKMEDVARGGRTILFVSHNLGAIGSLCPRSICLESGRIETIGATADVISQYYSLIDNNSKQSLQTLRLGALGDRVMFRRIDLSLDGQNLVSFGEPIVYSLCVGSKVSAKDLSIGHSIFNSAGSCVGTLITDESVSIDAGGEVNLTLVVPNLHLAPGRYYAGFSIGRGGRGSPRQDLDIVIGQPWFEVIGFGEDITSHWHQNWGNIVIKGAQLEIGSTKRIDIASEPRLVF
jgi:homopolymeric O-antigen transport system ATP-binding protein